MAPHSSTLAWRSLVGCSPWGREESDTTERLPLHFSLSCIGEGNGNPFQCSCLENPRNGGAWWAAVSGVAQSRTRLKQLSSSIKTPPGPLTEQRTGQSSLAADCPSPTGDRQARAARAGRGNLGPREASSTKLQAGFIANQDFLGFWTVDICQEGRSQRSPPPRGDTRYA